MTFTYQPGVRIVLGYAGRAENPPPTYASDATLALESAVLSLGKDWKKVASSFVVAPAARSGRVVVGLALGRAPVIFDTPRAIGPNTSIAKEHYVAPSGFASPPDVDKYGNTQAHQGILDALRAGESDARLAGLGLTLDDTDQDAAYFLVSDDGRSGAFVLGQALWKPGAPYEGGAARTYARDYGDGEAVRVVGVPYAEVGADAPLARLDASRGARDAHRDAATVAVKALLDTNVAWSWFLVSGDAPSSDGEAAPETRSAETNREEPMRDAAVLAERFVKRPISACIAALEAVAGVGTLPSQALDLPRIACGYSPDDLSKPADSAPHTALYAFDAEPERVVLTGPAALLRAVPADALGAWNANASGRWTGGDDWIVADLELVSEQDDDAFDTRVAAIVLGERGVALSSPRHLRPSPRLRPLGPRSMAALRPLARRVARAEGARVRPVNSEGDGVRAA